MFPTHQPVSLSFVRWNPPQRPLPEWSSREPHLWPATSMKLGVALAEGAVSWGLISPPEVLQEHQGTHLIFLQSSIVNAIRSTKHNTPTRFGFAFALGIGDPPKQNIRCFSFSFSVKASALKISPGDSPSSMIHICVYFHAQIGLTPGGRARARRLARERERERAGGRARSGSQICCCLQASGTPTMQAGVRVRPARAPARSQAGALGRCAPCVLQTSKSKPWKYFMRPSRNRAHRPRTHGTS